MPRSTTLNLAQVCTATEAARTAMIVARLRTEANSATRLPLMLELLAHEQSHALFWKVLCEVWSSCDCTWHYRRLLLSMMERRAQSRWRHITAEMHPAEDWPNLVRVWRGCSRERVRAVSWTLDKEVAAGFARGHRGISVPNPVLASAEIPKTAIFFLAHERQELEVVLDPRKLRSVFINDVH